MNASGKPVLASVGLHVCRRQNSYRLGKTREGLLDRKLPSSLPASWQIVNMRMFRMSSAKLVTLSEATVWNYAVERCGKHDKRPRSTRH